MSRDNWERLVVAVVRRQQMLRLFHQDSISPSVISSISSDEFGSSPPFNSTPPAASYQCLSRQISISCHSGAEYSHYKGIKKVSYEGAADGTSYLPKPVRKKLQKLPSNVRKRVDVLRKTQATHDDLQSKLSRERAALETRYQNLYQPLYTLRYQIINSVVQAEDQVGEGGDEPGIPGFWLNALKGNKILAADISESDQEALRFLQEIKWTKIENWSGFRLEFHFSSNPFFQNSVLTKTYRTADEGGRDLEKAIGSKIEWYPGKNLTQKIRTKKWSRFERVIAGTRQCKSFFNFFSPPRVTEGRDLDEDSAENLLNLMAKDYEMGLVIKEGIIPHAVSWFVGGDIVSS